MQKDFHYCCIKVLADAAGFSKDDAEIIAFASQYVDDATEHKGIEIQNLPANLGRRSARGNVTVFEPTCTAHKGIQYLDCMKRDVQRKVYIPFHFPPANPVPANAGPKVAYDYRVQPGSHLARELVEQATQAAQRQPEDRQSALIRLGIALHTYADTWAHQRFSGRHSSRDNDIERIRIRNGATWESLGWLKQMRQNVLPDVGHAEAEELPDQSHRTWAYEHDATGIDYSRDNTTIFLEASESIHTLLSRGSARAKGWKSVAPKLEKCFSCNSDKLKEKLAVWRAEFPLSFDYDHLAWRRAALAGDDVDWDHFLHEQDFGTLRFNFADDRKWLLFHHWAMEQRTWVLSKIRQDLL